MVDGRSLVVLGSVPPVAHRAIAVRVPVENSRRSFVSDGDCVHVVVAGVGVAGGGGREVVEEGGVGDGAGCGDDARVVVVVVVVSFVGVSAAVVSVEVVVVVVSDVQLVSINEPSSAHSAYDGCGLLGCTDCEVDDTVSF